MHRNLERLSSGALMSGPQSGKTVEHNPMRNVAGQNYELSKELAMACDLAARPLSRIQHSSRQDICTPAMLSDVQFEIFRDFAKRYAGINIADFKKSMVSRRVRTRLKALKIETFEAYCKILRGPERDRELQQLINALTTNKTEFFREPHHFHHLAERGLKLLPMQTCRSKQLRIWSAGCSTGEEAYSIAMTLAPAFSVPANGSYRILATDIDTQVLAHASAGSYHVSSLGSVPLSQRDRYFTSSPGNPTQYAVIPPIRDRILFQKLNLHDPWPMKGRFDVVFCRNVVIYFDKETQKRLFERFADILEMGGLLYCGHSESLHGVSSRFKAIGQSIYQRTS